MMNTTLVVFLCVVCVSSGAERNFSQDFLFGVAGSAYQVEGAWNEDGKGPSIWDTFSHTLGKVHNNETGDMACDAYHKFKEDIAILKYLGVKSYRLSISWPRILPKGIPSEVNQAGIDYYITLLKELKAAGIEPFVTLYHWDLPQHFIDLGGWLNLRMVDYFGDYARLCYLYFGEYVKYWITINEPFSTCMNGYEKGTFAPGVAMKGEAFYLCNYVQLLSHARAYHIYDQEFRAKHHGKISLTNLCVWFYPRTNSSEDQEAQERALAFTCHNYFYPIYYGNWPKVVIDRVATRSKLEGYSFSRLPEFSSEQSKYIIGTSDFLAFNTYTSGVVFHYPDLPISNPSFDGDFGVVGMSDPSWPVSATDWLTSDPPGIRHLLNHLRDTYQPNEIIITENGWADLGGLYDYGRISYYKGYLSNVLDAIVEDGVNVIGYFAWCLLDNFEWAEGYKLKFGLVDVDFTDSERPRTLKSSAQWYRQLVTTGNIPD